MLADGEIKIQGPSISVPQATPSRSASSIPTITNFTVFKSVPFDKGFGRLYVSAESGIVSIFDERGRNLEKVGRGFYAANAHTVAVDQRTHRVYFPLQSVNGKPVLRIAVPSDKQIP